MKWVAVLARQVGLMALACTVAAAASATLAFLNVIVLEGNRVDLDPVFFLTYALWSYAYFVFMFALPVLPVLWAAQRLGLAAELVCVLLAPIYATFVSTPLDLVLDNPVNAFLNSIGIVGAITAAVALYFSGDAYLDWRSRLITRS